MKGKVLLSMVMFGLSLFTVAATVNLGQVTIFPWYYWTPPDQIMDISAGEYHTCVRRFNGDVSCWGRNDRGQVGVSAAWAVHHPVSVGTGFQQIDAGNNHTCALNFSGGASCWGDSSYGQLGSGNSYYGYQDCVVPVSGGLTFTSISAGKYSTCGTATTGIYCWGNIVNNNIGVAYPVQLSSTTAYRSVTVGLRHVCALYVWGNWRQTDCMGNNDLGQMATTPGMFFLAGYPLPSLFGSAVSRVTTQVNFTCVDQVSGVVQCSGDNSRNQLGGATGGSSNQPHTVGGGMALRGVTTGLNHACVLDPSNRALCWGDGPRGELGNNTYAFTPNPYNFSTPQPVIGGFTFRALAAGEHHTCGVTTNNQVYCWGDNSYGQLGQWWTGNFTAAPMYPVYF